MIENFLRPAQGPAEAGADALRVIGALSVVVAAVFFDPTDAGVVAFALPGLVAPRFIGMRAGADAVVTVTLLVAAWSNVFDLYTTVYWWDDVIHFVCGGVVGVLMYLLLAHFRIVAVPGKTGFTTAGAAVLTALFGVALSALWEMVEWFGYEYITTDIYVTYADTISDMAAGGLGALAAGVLLAFVPLLRPAVQMARPASTEAV